MLSIRNNLSSFIAKNSLQTSTNNLNQAIERMTTGAKINHAKDNAANYSINTNMTTKIGAYNVAADNVAMGMELIGTAEGSLNLISEHLQRLRDLAVQSANGTYGAQSQEAINAEANARIEEIERLYNTAEYNGIKLFSAKNFDEMERVSEAVSIEANKSYRIDDYTDLKALQDFVNGGGNTTNVTFELTSDIYMYGKDFRGIGVSDTLAFKGTFNGNGHVINNLNISTSQNYVGLFGKTIGATIDSVGLRECNISGGSYQGGLIGSASNSNITNCFVTGKVGYDSNTGYVGGLVGSISNGTIKNSYSNVQIKSGGFVGGLVGSSSATIENCYALGTVNGQGYVGGLVGSSSSGGVITNCYATSDLPNTGSPAGGLVGQNYATITNCYATGGVSGSYPSGAFTGVNTGSISGSYCSRYANPNIVGYGDATGVEAKTVAEIKAICTPEAMGFTEANGWTVVNGTPRLAWEFSNGSDLNQPLLDVSISLQVGVDSSENSSIRFNVSIDLSGLSNIMDAGLSDSSSLEKIDDLLALTSEKAVEYGAVSNRLESVFNEILIQHDNLVSSRSTIRDADIAELSSTYIQQQILQQASATLLSSAQNVQAQNVLGLLQSLS